jgi:mercuric ion binding protein
MKYLLSLFIVTFLFVGCQKQQELQTTIVKANSMVCGTCAKTIEKAVYRVDGVKEVNVDVKAKTVEIKFVPLQTNVETIEMAISEAGYDANNRKRNPDAYEKLDTCCKING